MSAYPVDWLTVNYAEDWSDTTDGNVPVSENSSVVNCLEKSYKAWFEVSPQYTSGGDEYSINEEYWRVFHSIGITTTITSEQWLEIPSWTVVTNAYWERETRPGELVRFGQNTHWLIPSVVDNFNLGVVDKTLNIDFTDGEKFRYYWSITYDDGTEIYSRVSSWITFHKAAATPTPTRTFTQTPSPVPTRTNTPTPTFTNTPIPTWTPTATRTPIPTSTGTPAPTNTATPTRTPLPPTNTPTATYTPIPTNTPTNTPTSTNTPTNTYAPTNTATNTSTPTGTRTPVPTNTATATATRTLAPTFTPTNTVAPTATNTPVPATATPIPTATNTNTPTPTNTVPPTNTNTPTATYTPTYTPVNTSTPTRTYTPTNTPNPAASFTINDVWEADSSTAEYLTLEMTDVDRSVYFLEAGATADTKYRNTHFADYSNGSAYFTIGAGLNITYTNNTPDYVYVYIRIHMQTYGPDFPTQDQYVMNDDSDSSYVKEYTSKTWDVGTNLHFPIPDHAGSYAYISYQLFVGSTHVMDISSNNVIYFYVGYPPTPTPTATFTPTVTPTFTFTPTPTNTPTRTPVPLAPLGLKLDNKLYFLVRKAN